MKKILVLILLIMICLTGCQNDQETSEPTKAPEINRPVTVEDNIELYKSRYSTELVFRDSLNPVLYLVITDDQVMWITQAPDVDYRTMFTRKYISQIETEEVGPYKIITFTTITDNTNIFTASSDDYNIIMAEIY